MIRLNMPYSIPYSNSTEWLENNNFSFKTLYAPSFILKEHDHNTNLAFIRLTYKDRLKYLIGPPKATETYSVEELENMGTIGLYEHKKT